jgi:hypothetical protein
MVPKKNFAVELESVLSTCPFYNRLDRLMSRKPPKFKKHSLKTTKYKENKAALDQSRRGQIIKWLKKPENSNILNSKRGTVLLKLSSYIGADVESASSYINNYLEAKKVRTLGCHWLT